MAAHDRIRLIGLLRDGPREGLVLFAGTFARCSVEACVYPISPPRCHRADKWYGRHSFWSDERTFMSAAAHLPALVAGANMCSVDDRLRPHPALRARCRR